MHDGIAIAHQLQGRSQIRQVGGDLTPCAPDRRHSIDAQHVMAGGKQGLGNVAAKQATGTGDDRPHITALGSQAQRLGYH
ncbi:Uncharacterized protein MLTONO_6443 [Mesorhizobium loti]|nr:Uncharacterized protein MLTONO_6443 [Mesorhizobium loti]